MARNKDLPSKLRRAKKQNQSKNSTEDEITDWEIKGMSQEDYVEFKKSGLSENQWNTYILNRNNKSKAFWLSFFLPAGGQYYNHDGIKGISCQLIMIGGILFAVNNGFDKIYDPPNPDGSKPWHEEYNTKYYIGMSIPIIAWIWSWFDARSSAIDYNENLKKKYKLAFAPKLNRYSKQPMLGVRISF